jgi:alkylation response protein AidB-like acyl-CoA dehydrogenase
MNFDLTDDQRSIQRTAHDFLAAGYKSEEIRRLAYETDRGFSDEGWQRICELGWPALLVDEEHGGLGLGVVELAVVQEEMGAALAPSPFLSTVAAAALIADAGSDEQRERWLPALAAGEARGTVATLRDGDGDGDGDGWTAVPDADGADVVVLRDGDAWALAEDVSAEPANALDPTRRLWSIEVGGGREPLPGDGARAADVIAVALAAESVGVARRTLDMAVGYAKEREQFGRPIGAYQAVSHACAQMLLEVEGARSTTLYAAWALDHEPESGPLAASMAKAYASDAGWRVPAAALQVHGGIGFTWEHDLHLWLKRGKANAYLWGDAREHRARVAQLIGLD